MTDKKIVIKHVPSIKRMNEIIKEVEVKGTYIVKKPTSRTLVLELQNEIIYFIVWYEMAKIWKHVNGNYGCGEIDLSEIDKEFDFMKKFMQLRKSVCESKIEDASNAN